MSARNEIGPNMPGAKVTIEDACREMGHTLPQRLGDQLTPDALKEMFRQHPEGLHFWITDAFHQIDRRVTPQECFRFWKAEIAERLMKDGIFMADKWPDGYAYLAQQWVSPYPEPLIELMRCD
jgi:hypothetical protein